MRTLELRVPRRRGETARVLPKAGWPQVAVVLVPCSSHFQVPLGAPSPSLTRNPGGDSGCAGGSDGVSCASLALSRPGCTVPAPPLGGRTDQCRRSLCFRSHHSPASRFLLPNLSLLQANKGEFEIIAQSCGVLVSYLLGWGSGGPGNISENDAGHSGWTDLVPSEQGVTGRSALPTWLCGHSQCGSAFPPRPPAGGRCLLPLPSPFLGGKGQPQQETVSVCNGTPGNE